MKPQTAVEYKVLGYPDVMKEIERIGPAISQNAEKEIQQRRLSPETMRSLRESGMFRLFMPGSLGGLELDPVSVAKIVEEIARYNTAAAWSLMVVNTGLWWGARIPDEAIDTLYRDNADCFQAGSFYPPMMAMEVNGGYQVNGRCALVSNIHEAQWIFVSALVSENGQVKMVNGMPEVIGVVMHAGDCLIKDTWYTIGMQATDSNDVVAENVFVPSHLSFPLRPGFQPNRYYQSALYRYPAIGASIGSLIAPIALAVARNAIEELKQIAAKKISFGARLALRERSTIQRKLGMAEAMVQSAHAYLYHELDACWDKIIKGQTITVEEKANMMLAVTHVNQSCSQAVDIIYSAAGTTGIYTSSKLSRLFADAQVIRQHGFSNDSRYETAAQLHFGLEPDLPVVLF